MEGEQMEFKVGDMYLWHEHPWRLTSVTDKSLAFETSPGEFCTFAIEFVLGRIKRGDMRKVEDGK